MNIIFLVEIKTKDLAEGDAFFFFNFFYSFDASEWEIGIAIHSFKMLRFKRTADESHYCFKFHFQFSLINSECMCSLLCYCLILLKILCFNLP